jgi:hypothetical protein
MPRRRGDVERHLSRSWVWRLDAERRWLRVFRLLLMVQAPEPLVLDPSDLVHTS